MNSLLGGSTKIHPSNKNFGKIGRRDKHFTRRPAYVHGISQFTRRVHEMEVDKLNTKWRYGDEIYVSGNWGKNATNVKIFYNTTKFYLLYCYKISNYNYMFRPYLVAIIRLYILIFKSFVQIITARLTFRLQLCSKTLFLNRRAADRTGPWHQLYRAVRGSHGICHFSVLSIFHE